MICEIIVIVVLSTVGTNLYGVKGQKVAQNEKLHLSRAISQEQYSTWSWFLVLLCQMMISPVVFFIFSKFWFFRLLGGKGAKKGPKWQNSAHSISQEWYIIWSSFVVHKCKMMISPGVFSFFLNFDYFGLLGGKRAKNDPKWQKIMSVALQVSATIITWMSFMVHMCKMIISPGVIFFFFFNFDFSCS